MADEKNIEYASSVKVCVGGRLSWNLELEGIRVVTCHMSPAF